MDIENLLTCWYYAPEGLEDEQLANIDQFFVEMTSTLDKMIFNGALNCDAAFNHIKAQRLKSFAMIAERQNKMEV